MKNFVVWFEIPVNKIERAAKFYSTVFGADLSRMEKGPVKMALFPFKPGLASGMLVESKDNKPAKNGTIVYLDGGEDLNVPLKRVEGAGGKVILKKTSIDEHGFMAHFEDTEGNRVALHSMK